MSNDEAQSAAQLQLFPRSLALGCMRRDTKGVWSPECGLLRPCADRRAQYAHVGLKMTHGVLCFGQFLLCPDSRVVNKNYTDRKNGGNVIGA